MNPLQSLVRLARSQPGAPPREVETCELCSQPIESEHRHVFDLDSQGLHCVCRACAMLFIEPRPGTRYQTIGDRVLRDPGLHIPEVAWTALQIPVRLAFFTCDGATERWQATYPSVAGPTRAELDPAAWAPIGESRLVRALAPRSEALLVFSRRPNEPLEAFGVALDLCFSLVGLLRRKWRGFSGGDEVWTEVERFFAQLRARAVPIRPGEGEPSSP